MARKADRTSSASRAPAREPARPASSKRARREASPAPPPPTVREKVVRQLRRARLFALAIVALVALLDILFILGVIDRGRIEDLWPFHWRRPGPQFITDSSAALAPFYAPTVLHWQSSIERWAREYEVNPNVIAIVMQIESCGDPEAVSGAGALGLMQVMPFHFSYGENMINPETNVRRGISVFHECLKDFAGWDLGMALACYNGGPSVTQRDYSTWAHETQSYYRWATGMWNEVVSNSSSSATLDDWLAAGGARLCQQAVSRLAGAAPTTYVPSLNRPGEGESGSAVAVVPVAYSR